MTTTKDIRAKLINEIDSLIAGTTTASRAKAVAALARAAISTAQFELQHAAASADKARAPLPVEL